MLIIKLLLYPISVLYGIIIIIRNRLYDYNILTSKEFKIPIIVVGNLTVGGTGKTPHTEYLIRLLKENFKIATLSRGYKRKTKNFVEATAESSFKDVGDEALQIKRKFPEIPVAVEKNRPKGAENILSRYEETEVILLDDAFQHRAIKPSLSILLTDYSKPYWDNYLLPLGTLREQHYEVRRADIVIVTKTPNQLSPIEQRILKEQINPLPYQSVFLSYIKYGTAIPFNRKIAKKINNNNLFFDKKYKIILFTGIANPTPFENYLKENKCDYKLMQFPDHHEFSKSDLMQVKKAFDEIKLSNKVLLTTEKDAMRLDNPILSEFTLELPIYYVPIEIAFHDKKENQFNSQILEHIRKFRIFN